MDGFRQNIADLKEQLAQSAGIDPLSDRFTSGAIQAYTDILDIKLEEVIDED